MFFPFNNFRRISVPVNSSQRVMFTATSDCLVLPILQGTPNTGVSTANRVQHRLDGIFDTAVDLNDVVLNITYIDGGIDPSFQIINTRPASMKAGDDLYGFNNNNAFYLYVFEFPSTP